jgi:aspartate/methionine/tyrosine aminotransferase
MFADRLQEIAPFRVMELMERAKLLESRGERVVHFEVGEPDFETAPSIVSAGQRALADGQTKYTQALGIPALRERIADYYRQNAGVAVPPERIVVTSGASGGLLLLCALILNHEDELLMADPGYPCNEVFARLAGGRPVQLPTQAASGFQLTAGQVRDAWTERTRGLLLASPANPTGVMTGAQQLREVIAVCLGKQGLVILDEIYQGLVYGEVEYRTGLEISDELFVLNSFSKYFGMTGWRLGWMVMPEAAVDAVTPLAQNLFISPSSIAQYAALAAFDDEAMAVHEQRRQIFQRRRDLLARGLQDLGLEIPVTPSGAFYLYVDISSTGMNSSEFCWRLIDEFHVAVTPGNDFGSADPDRYVRFAYTTSDEDINLGLTRLARALEQWRSTDCS